MSYNESNTVASWAETAPRGTAASPATAPATVPLADDDLDSVSGGDFFADAQAALDRIAAEIQNAVDHVFGRDQA